jgi:dipeptidyl aminopeptidase/acylaminoacyl peptidase
LIERSPKTHLHKMAAPMLVIQGRNDPRVVAAESEDLVRQLKAKGKQIELLVFEDEGHDVLKYEQPRHLLQRHHGFLCEAFETLK